MTLPLFLLPGLFQGFFSSLYLYFESFLTKRFLKLLSSLILPLELRKRKKSTPFQGRKTISMVTSHTPWWHSGKESTCPCGRYKIHEFDPWVRKILQSRKWQPASVYLPRKSHGRRSLAGYSPWNHKGSDATEHTQQSYSQNSNPGLYKSKLPTSSQLLLKKYNCLNTAR